MVQSRRPEKAIESPHELKLVRLFIFSDVTEFLWRSRANSCAAGHLGEIPKWQKSTMMRCLPTGG
jgi:hypothetical protein